MTALEKISAEAFDALVEGAGVSIVIGENEVRGLVTSHSSRFAPLDSERQAFSIAVRASDFPNGFPFEKIITVRSSGERHRVRSVDVRGPMIVCETERLGRSLTGPLVA